jgi:hypothetical protein
MRQEELKNDSLLVCDSINIGSLSLHYPNHHPIFLLQSNQTPRAQTPIIQLTYILHLVQIQLHGTALAF